MKEREVVKEVVGDFAVRRMTDEVGAADSCALITFAQFPQLLCPFTLDAGARAFSDDGKPVHSSQVMRKALEYSKVFGVPIIDHGHGVSVAYCTATSLQPDTIAETGRELALDIWGAESMLVDVGPEVGSWPGSGRDKRRENYPASAMMSAFFFSRSETIWGGTSQIQRNIVGERVLGLPKEPKPA